MWCTHEKVDGLRWEQHELEGKPGLLNKFQKNWIIECDLRLKNP